MIIRGKKDITFRDKDITFRDIELEKWKSLFTDVEVHEFDDVEHFVQEELGEELCPLVERQLEKIKT